MSCRDGLLDVDGPVEICLGDALFRLGRPIFFAIVSDERGLLGGICPRF